MKELQAIVKEKITSMCSDGTVEKYIHAQVERTIKECVESTLKSYGEFGKVVSEKIKTAMGVAGHDIEIPSYNQFVKQAAEDAFIAVLNKNAVSQLTELMESIIEPVKKTAKISELLDQIEEAWGQCAIENHHEEIRIDCKINEEGTVKYVTIHHPEFDWESVKVTFYNHKRDDGNLWHIGYINEGDKIVSGRAINQAKIVLNGVTAELFKYYSMGTQFEMDTEIESIYVSPY